ncbi:MAG: hypothetical protein CMJ31_03305 [Phycisphaerae bacterium]|nr:hypothetical protein [Phycisphaerae bacterium]
MGSVHTFPWRWTQLAKAEAGVPYPDAVELVGGVARRVHKGSWLVYATIGTFMLVNLAIVWHGLMVVLAFQFALLAVLCLAGARWSPFRSLVYDRWLGGAVEREIKRCCERPACFWCGFDCDHGARTPDSAIHCPECGGLTPNPRGAIESG